MLAWSPDTLARFGAVSEATVREMVAGALRHSQAQIALAISGIAGPGGGTAEKAVGTCGSPGVSRGRRVWRACTKLVRQSCGIRAQAVRIALQGVLEMLGKRTETA